MCVCSLIPSTSTPATLAEAIVEKGLIGRAHPVEKLVCVMQGAV